MVVGGNFGLRGMRSLNQLLRKGSVLGRNCQNYNTSNVRLTLNHDSAKHCRVPRFQQCLRTYSSVIADGEMADIKKSDTIGDSASSEFDPAAAKPIVDRDAEMETIVDGAILEKKINATVTSELNINHDKDTEIPIEGEAASELGTTTIESVINHQSTKEGVPDYSQNPLPEISAKLRQVMRHMPHSVVILLPGKLPNTKRKTKYGITVHGMTLSSFTTVTLTPKPIVTFNIKEPSRTLNILSASESGEFNIYLLDASEESKDIAETFSRNDGKRVNFTKLHAKPNYDLRRPIMRLLNCRVLEKVKAGDHMLILGEVVAIEEKPRTGEDERPWTGLSYIHGAYSRSIPQLRSNKLIPLEPKNSGETTEPPVVEDVSSG